MRVCILLGLISAMCFTFHRKLSLVSKANGMWFSSRSRRIESVNRPWMGSELLIFSPGRKGLCNRSRGPSPSDHGPKTSLALKGKAQHQTSIPQRLRDLLEHHSPDFQSSFGRHCNQEWRRSMSKRDKIQARNLDLGMRVCILLGLISAMCFTFHRKLSLVSKTKGM
jgi:hypothetical protein